MLMHSLWIAGICSWDSFQFVGYCTYLSVWVLMDDGLSTVGLCEVVLCEKVKS
jgi:hypothetical protein